MIQPQQLRVLAAIRDAGSLTRAAALLGYGVPTIAHHLATLERQARTQLVERDRRGARLTPLGEFLVQEGQEVLTRLAEVERELAARRDLGVSVLRVGTFASVGSRLLPRAIRDLQGRLAVHVEVVEAEPTEVVERLGTGDLHAGLVYDLADDPTFVGPDLDSTLLLDEPYQVLVARDHPLAAQRQVRFADLAGVDWICSRHQDEASDRVLRRACRQAGFEPSVAMRTDDLSMIHGLVAAGLGLTLATPNTVDTRFEVAARPAAPELPRRITSFVSRRRAVPPAVVALRDALTGLVRPSA